MSKPVFSVVVPVFNSEASLNELFSRLTQVMDGQEKAYELIFVDDGSMDNSWDKLKQFKEGHPENVTVVRLAKNFGQHSATFCGFTFATGEYIITIDDDLQNPPEEIPLLVQAMEKGDAELVYGISDEKKHVFYRNLGSRFVKRISAMMGKPREGSSFRLIAGSVVQKILQYQQNFVFIDEILNWYTDAVVFVKVDHQPRKYKSSNYNPRKIWSIMTNLTIYYTTVPLKLMVYGGVILSVIFLILTLYFVYRKIFLDVPLGYTSLIVAILFSTSLILLSLGMIGEYLSRIYQVQNKKPLYSIRKVL